MLRISADSDDDVRVGNLPAASPDEIAQFSPSVTELLVSIGGVVGHLVLTGAPARLLSELRRRCGPFCLPCSPHVDRAFTLRIALQGSPVPAAAPSAGPPRLHTRADRIEI